MVFPGVAEHHSRKIMKSMYATIILQMISNAEKTLIIVEHGVIVVVKERLIIDEANHPPVVMYFDDDSIDVNGR